MHAQVPSPTQVYCKPHFKQLFQLKGNYNEGSFHQLISFVYTRRVVVFVPLTQPGFGTDPHKHKWDRQSVVEPTGSAVAAAGLPTYDAAGDEDELGTGSTDT